MSENTPDNLVDIMKTLRSKDGCPWDLEQTHASLKPYLVEECYECLEAIDLGDDEELKHELGDVLLQVVFHAQIASERGVFDFKDIEKAICEKMVRRHPHVFDQASVETVEQVKVQWQQIKEKERNNKDSKLEQKKLDAALPSGLPALQKAVKIQNRASKRGFEWPSIEGVLDKLKEEVSELEEAIAQGDQHEIESELGDLFFVLVKASRFLELDSEKALHKTIGKFVHRFHEMELALNQDGYNVEDSSLDQLTKYWNSAKSKDL